MSKKITWPSKIIALSFIGLILLTNVWLHYHLFGGEFPQWAVLLTDICIAGVFFGSLVQAFLWVKKRLSQNHDE